MSLLDQTIHPIPREHVRVVHGIAGIGRLEQEALSHMMGLMATGMGVINASIKANDLYGVAVAALRSMYYRQRRASSVVAV
jgi:hypothetical protein